MLYVEDHLHAWYPYRDCMQLVLRTLSASEGANRDLITPVSTSEGPAVLLSGSVGPIRRYVHAHALSGACPRGLLLLLYLQLQSTSIQHKTPPMVRDSWSCDRASGQFPTSLLISIACDSRTETPRLGCSTFHPRSYYLAERVGARAAGRCFCVLALGCFAH